MASTQKSAKQVHYRLSLPSALSERFEALAAKPGVTKSALLAEGLRLLIERRGASEVEQRFSMRLDRISKQLARLERNTHIELETLALFVRYMLTVNAPISEEDEVSRAIGRDRFEAFVKRVSRQLVRGRITLDQEEQP